MICQCTIADSLCDAREAWAKRCDQDATESVPLDFTRERIVYVWVCREHHDEFIRQMDSA